MKLLLSLLLVLASLPLSAQENKKNAYQEYLNKMKEESKTFYADADSAHYGIKYRWKYRFNKQYGLTYEEDRCVLVAPDVTLDMPYQKIGERNWMRKNPDDGATKQDSNLAYRLTPSFYFYYPKEKHLKKTYRIVDEEFLLGDTIVAPQWKYSETTRIVGDYVCHKAEGTVGGRKWTVWYTTELPFTAGPRTLVGLPGVVIEAKDEAGEIEWTYTGTIKDTPEEKLHILFPRHFSPIPLADFPKIKKVFALSRKSYIDQSGLATRRKTVLPEKLYPYTGIDACVIDNPIER